MSNEPIDVLAVLREYAQDTGPFRVNKQGATNLAAACAAIAELIEAANKAKRAYWLARNSAAGLTNYCEESGSTRRCERELAEAEQIYRDSAFDAALARCGVTG